MGTTDREQFIPGYWAGSMYGLGGHRMEWRLTLELDGTYSRAITSRSETVEEDAGTWAYDSDSGTIAFRPADPNVIRAPWWPDHPGATESRWWVLDVTGCEGANTLLVLRHAVLASRNLPILLYRVHHSNPNASVH